MPARDLDRDKKLLEFLKKPKTSKDIMAEFGLAQNTVTDWIKRLRSKIVIVSWREPKGMGGWTPFYAKKTKKNSVDVPRPVETKASGVTLLRRAHEKRMRHIKEEFEPLIAAEKDPEKRRLIQRQKDNAVKRERALYAKRLENNRKAWKVSRDKTRARKKHVNLFQTIQQALFVGGTNVQRPN